MCCFLLFSFALFVVCFVVFLLLVVSWLCLVMLKFKGFVSCLCVTMFV